MSNKATLWKLEQDKQELVAIRYKSMEGVLFHSRERWIAEGDFFFFFFFFLLEKRNYKSKQMTKGTFNNGEEIHESKDIIKDFFFFFLRKS